MDKKPLLMIIFLFLIVNAISVLAIDSIACVPVTVNQGGSISCEVDLADGITEKNQPENMTFYNDTAQTIIITDCSFAGITENAPDPENLLHTCNIPSNWGNTSSAIVNFSLPSLGTSIVFNFSISPIMANQLIIDEFAIETPIFMGKLTGARWTVSKSDTEKKVIGAECNGDLLQSIGGKLIPIAGSTGGFTTIKSKYAGHVLTSFTPSPSTLEEGTTYIVEVRCDCLPSNTACIDEDGNQIVNSTSIGLIGLGTTLLTVNKLLDINTIVNKNIYEMKEEIFICANVTNLNFSKRLALKIFHQVRCSKEEDINSDLDRVLIMSDAQIPDERGIDVNTTQMQCKRFIIPEAKYLQGRNNVCYASTDVIVLDEKHMGIIDYHTISNKFNITSNELNLVPDWERIDDYMFRTIINLSSNSYKDFNGTGTGNIDLKLLRQPASIGSEKQFNLVRVSFLDMLDTKFIKNITAKNATNEVITSALEFLDDGSLEIELRNVDISTNGWYNVTLELHNFEERQTVALEGINSSAGTFDFAISVPDTITSSTTVSGSGLTGDGRTLNRDITVKCQVDGSPFTLKQFEVFTTDKFSFSNIPMEIPNSLGMYTMRCTAIDNYFGEDAVQATDNFRVLTTFDTGATGGSTGTFEEEKINLTKEIGKVIEEKIEIIRRVEIIEKSALIVGSLTLLTLLIFGVKKVIEIYV